MKKIFIIAAVTFCLTMFLSAQDNSADTAQSAQPAPDAVTEATSKKPNVKVGVAVEVKDKNYIYTAGENTETHKQNFSGYRNKAVVQGGALVNINDRVVLSPYVRAHDLNFRTKDIKAHKTTDQTSDIVTEKNFRFQYGALKTGMSASVDATDFFSIGCNLFQWTYFTEENPVWAGLGYSLSLDFSIEKAFLEINLWDEISTRWADKDNATKNRILNLFDYGFQFNFFNFINPKINTGLYASGEFELDYDSKDGKFENNYLYNEVYTGIKSSPMPFLTFWAAYFVQAECNWNQDGSRVAGDGAIDMGLDTGITFKYNGFSVTFDYEGKLYRLGDRGIDDWVQKPISQSITITLGYKFKTYFAKK
ncbi:MAG: hypothetical protein IKQ61_12090 [Spirochaetales bacterium]|nr:hypothetical protein [Spirochaetales bacterium]MBR6200988.1 hypothetical protein [Spirochaetales bacterium]